MNAYRVIDTASTGPEGLRSYYRKTLKEAHDKAKEYGDDIRPDIRIEHVIIPTDASSVVGYLNWESPVDLEVLRTWKLTPRGGLVELGEDGKPLEKQA